MKTSRISSQPYCALKIQKLNKNSSRTTASIHGQYTYMPMVLNVVKKTKKKRNQIIFPSRAVSEEICAEWVDKEELYYFRQIITTESLPFYYNFYLFSTC